MRLRVFVNERLDGHPVCGKLLIFMYVYMYICMYVCMYVCMYTSRTQYSTGRTCFQVRISRFKRSSCRCSAARSRSNAVRTMLVYVRTFIHTYIHYMYSHIYCMLILDKHTFIALMDLLLIKCTYIHTILYFIHTYGTTYNIRY